MGMIFQQPTPQPQPGVHRRRPDRRVCAPAPRAQPPRRPRRGRWRCWIWCRSRGRAAGQRLPARVQRGHVPAGDDRHGRWRATRACSSRTSRPPPSTSPCRNASSTCCGDVQRQTGVALLFVSHDLAVVAELCQRVMVMYAGRGRRERPRRRTSSSAPALRTPPGCSARSPTRPTSPTVAWSPSPAASRRPGRGRPVAGSTTGAGTATRALRDRAPGDGPVAPLH